jgi:hypothetical protein
MFVMHECLTLLANIINIYPDRKILLPIAGIIESDLHFFDTLQRNTGFLILRFRIKMDQLIIMVILRVL